MKTLTRILTVALLGLVATPIAIAQSSMTSGEPVVQPGRRTGAPQKRPRMNRHQQTDTVAPVNMGVRASEAPATPTPRAATPTASRIGASSNSTPISKEPQTTSLHKEPQTTGPQSTLVPVDFPDTIRSADFSFYLNRAEKGDTEAQRRTGICYLYGTGVERDIRKGKEWIAKAALSENTEAQYDLGVMFRDGIGVKQNLPDAAYWFRKAARNGNALAQLNVGLLFLEGRGVQQDYRIAAENFWRSAEQGNVDAAYRVACMYRDGVGMSKDLSRAYHYFKLAASKGDYKDAASQAEALKQYAPGGRSSQRKKSKASKTTGSGRRNR